MPCKPATRASPRHNPWISALLVLLGAFFCISFGINAHAATAIVVDNQFTQINLGDNLDILEGDGSRVDNPHAQHHQFRQLDHGELIRSRHTRWLRFGIINKTGRDQLIVLQSPFPAKTHADYLVSASTPLKLSPLGSQDANNKGSLFLLQLPPAGIGLVYLRAAGEPLLDHPLQLMTLNNYLHTPQQQGWLRGLGQGILLVVLIVGLVIAAIARDTIYLWFIAAVFLHLLPSAMLWMTTAPYAFHLLTDVSRWLSSSWLLAAAMVLQVAIRFPAHPETSTFWRRLYNAMSIVAVIAAAALFVNTQWISLAILVALILPIILATTLGSMLGYMANQDKLLLGFALARIWIFVAAAVVIANQPDLENLPFSFFSQLMICTGTEMLMLLLMLALRTYHRLHEFSARHNAIAVAEAESRARTELTATMAHRIRTPASGVLGMIEMLQDAPLSPTQRDQLDTMQRAGNELLNAVNELSDFSRLELSSDPLQRSSFDMQALIVESVEGFRGLASTHALELITDFAPNLPRYVSGDQTRVRQLLLQLLHHAIAQFRNGEILLRVDGQDRHLQIALTVHGRSADDSADARGDANLRLAIARQLTTTLGGSIHLPEPDVPQSVTRAGGWRASFTLPLPAIERQPGSGGIDESLRHRRLLIIDDSETFCEVIQRRAEHWGMRVHSASTLSEGLARINNGRSIGEPIDAVLLDAELPEFADPDSLERLRSADLPDVVILLATLPETEHSQLAQMLAVRHVLLKPLDHTSLQLALIEELNTPAPRRAVNENAKPLHCLIAEDNPINALVLQGMLSKLGATFATAVNGQAAVEAFQRGDFDLVLMDCDMPVMDGFEAARRIREIQQNRLEAALPIIALTANTLEELGERARTGVMDAHLVKPVRLQSLRQVLEHWSGRTLTPRPD